jgi:hypothetical protein
LSVPAPHRFGGKSGHEVDRVSRASLAELVKDRVGEFFVRPFDLKTPAFQLIFQQLSEGAVRDIRAFDLVVLKFPVTFFGPLAALPPKFDSHVCRMEYALPDLNPNHFGPRRVQAVTETINDVSFLKLY